jgi:hypothetical protein
MDVVQKRVAFVENYGMFAEKVGFPPMAGRFFVWLLTSESPTQTAEQIVEGLNTSSEESKFVEYGLDLVKNSRRVLRQQLKTYHDLCFFCEHEFPKLIEKWEKERKRK